LTVIIDETLIEDAKIAAIRQKTNVSRVADELLRGWLSGLYQLKNRPTDEPIALDRRTPRPNPRDPVTGIEIVTEGILAVEVADRVKLTPL
jgi:hypothetical protein